ncbi:hypothetical protein H1P_4240004 [Hyella patelloides LEGE 07179]|uniref:Uncharacterized protein n=1 Tax=Hyella patelloides LEGE 07179 TaxID=945734 RepID=A0A563VY96_9CYAN|nr:hypothetical protein H1P_4240004 [Hyella patelloides LEGE 07179]
MLCYHLNLRILRIKNFLNEDAMSEIAFLISAIFMNAIPKN